jgi:putative transposase
MNAALSLSHDVGKKDACESLKVPRASFYRFHSEKIQENHGRPAPPLSLSLQEKSNVLDILHSDPFCDKTPYQIYAALLDEGKYYCSIRTMYRLLTAEHGDVKERRRQVSRPAYSKPELLANGPNQVWSWDITKLKSHTKWTYFYLYVIIDIYSRYVVGWMVAHKEQDALAKRFIQESCMKQDIEPGQLTIHADRGSSMKSKTVANLLVDLGVIKTHSRPHVSNDNPFSEAQFKTLKYCPEFPGNFGSIQDARSFCRTFFDWYNNEHHHSGIALMTPQQVHYGFADEIYSHRCETLSNAFRKNPLRFKNIMPTPEKPPEAVWINKPESDDIRV